MLQLASHKTIFSKLSALFQFSVATLLLSLFMTSAPGHVALALVTTPVSSSCIYGIF